MIKQRSDNWPWQPAASPQPPGLAALKWPRITIVTPSYNQGAYLEETIRSVLLQQYPNLEYIVIDGGSTDNSVDIIRKYAHQLTYWESQPDRGQSHAINKGFARATGDIMGWINSDDGMLPGALHTVATRLTTDDELLVGACTVADGFADRHNAAYSLKTPTFERMIYRGNTLWQPGVFWPRRLWELAGPLSESLHYTMDYDLFMRMMPHVRQMVLVD